MSTSEQYMIFEFGKETIKKIVSSVVETIDSGETKIVSDSVFKITTSIIVKSPGKKELEVLLSRSDKRTTPDKFLYKVPETLDGLGTILNRIKENFEEMRLSHPDYHPKMNDRGFNGKSAGRRTREHCGSKGGVE